MKVLYIVLGLIAIYGDLCYFTPDNDVSQTADTEHDMTRSEEEIRLQSLLKKKKTKGSFIKASPAIHVVPTTSTIKTITTTTIVPFTSSIHAELIPAEINSENEEVTNDVTSKKIDIDLTTTTTANTRTPSITTISLIAELIKKRKSKASIINAAPAIRVVSTTTIPTTTIVPSTSSTQAELISTELNNENEEVANDVTLKKNIDFTTTTKATTRTPSTTITTTSTTTVVPSTSPIQTKLYKKKKSKASFIITATVIDFTTTTTTTTTPSSTTIATAVATTTDSSEQVDLIILKSPLNKNEDNTMEITPEKNIGDSYTTIEPGSIPAEEEVNSDISAEEDTLKTTEMTTTTTTMMSFATRMKNYFRNLTLTQENNWKIISLYKGVFNVSLQVSYKGLDISKRIRDIQNICKAFNNMPSYQFDIDKIKYAENMVKSLNITTLKFDSIKRINGMQTICSYIGNVNRQKIEEKMKNVKDYIDVNGKEHAKTMISIANVYGSKIPSLFICLGSDWFKTCNTATMSCLRHSQHNLCLWKIACGGKSYCTPQSYYLFTSRTTTMAPNDALTISRFECDTLKECLAAINFPWKTFLEEYKVVPSKNSATVSTTETTIPWPI